MELHSMRTADQFPPVRRPRMYMSSNNEMIFCALWMHLVAWEDMSMPAVDLSSGGLMAWRKDDRYK